MSDAARKPMTDKISEAITPESSKSTTQKAKEGITGAGDKVAREGQTDDSKGLPQKMSDKAGRGKDEEQHGGSGGGIVDSIKHAAGMDK